MIKIDMEDRNKLICQLLHRITTQELKKLLALDSNAQTNTSIKN